MESKYDENKKPKKIACSVCTFENNEGNNICEMCENILPGKESAFDLGTLDPE
jgi:hypothetical protein